MNILFLSKSPDATAYYRCDIPAKYLRKAGHEVRQSLLEPFKEERGYKKADVEWAELIILQRPLTEYSLRFLTEVKRLYPRKVLIGDYDDDYFSVPSWNPGYTFVKANQPFWRQMFQLYDGITVSTLNLAEVLEKRTRVPIATVPNGFDFEAFDALEPCQPFNIQATVQGQGGGAQHEYQITNEQFNELMAERTVIAWAGSRFHFVDIDYLAGVLAQVVKNDPSVVFLFIGYIQAHVLREVPISHLFTCAGRYPTLEFYRLLKSFKIDIALAPLDPCPFNASKSNLKILESMAISAYPVCSEFDPYEDDLDLEATHWEGSHYMPRHGCLVGYDGGSKDWVRVIGEAVGKMKHIDCKRLYARHNQRYVRTRHDASTRTALYENFFHRLLSAKASIP